MNVYLETLQTKGSQIKGEITKYEHIKKIIEKEDGYEFYVNENYSIFCTKEMKRIAFIN